MTTQSELIELSIAAAKMAGIAPVLYKSVEGFEKNEGFWLHEDSARCFELMCRYELYITSAKGWIQAYDAERNGVVTEWLGETCREQATRIAILKAVVAIGEQK